jgi:hypothetical protein
LNESSREISFILLRTGVYRTPRLDRSASVLGCQHVIEIVDHRPLRRRLHLHRPAWAVLLQEKMDEDVFANPSLSQYERIPAVRKEAISRRFVNMEQVEHRELSG